MATPRSTRLWATLPLSTLALACAGAPLPVRPPTADYETGETDVSQLSPSQRELVDGLNAALEKQGLPKAVPGSYEMDVAALIANAGRTKQNGATAAGPSRGTNLGMGASDETATDSDAKIHVEQRLYERGLPAGLKTWFSVEDFPKHALNQDDFAKAVRALAPLHLYGKLRVGAAVATDGWDNHRVFSIALRDETADLTKGPPRTTEPQTSFAIEGTVVDPSLKKISLRVLRADAKVDEQSIPVGDGGHFKADYTVPAAKGTYVATLLLNSLDALTMPFFVGTPASAWPALAPKDAVAPTTSRELALQLVRSIASWTHGANQSPPSLTPELCALAKKLAAKDLSDDALQAALKEASPSLAFWRGFVTEDNAADFAAAAPWDASAAQLFLSPGKGYGLGVARLPKKSDDDANVYEVIWLAQKGAPAPSASR
ncbi:MAG: hypothetical protein ACYCWW_13815 [Deltaproteobacteria bacterium]